LRRNVIILKNITNRISFILSNYCLSKYLSIFSVFHETKQRALKMAQELDDDLKGVLKNLLIEQFGTTEKV
jgi:hypothetical protein